MRHLKLIRLRVLYTTTVKVNDTFIKFLYLKNMYSLCNQHSFVKQIFIQFLVFEVYYIRFISWQIGPKNPLYHR